MNREEFVKEIKQKRITNGWYSFIGIVEGKVIKLKGFKTWLQIYTIDGIDNSNCMERTVTQFKEDLLKPLT